MNTSTEATDLLSTDRVWYHGTHDESGLDVGDYMNPGKGAFEACVWLTSCPTRAAGYAHDAVVASRSETAEPVVYEIRIVEGSIVGLGDEDASDLEIAVQQHGEHGVPTAAVLARHSAIVARQIA